MYLTEFIFDLNDIYGRFVPGIVLIIALFFIVHGVWVPFDIPFLISWFLDNFLVSTIIISFAAVLIGGIPLQIIFLLKPIFIKYSIDDILAEIDISKYKMITKKIHLHFCSDALTSRRHTDLIRSQMKAYLLENSMSAYIQTKRIEAKINLNAGLIIPTFLAVIASLLYKNTWSLTIILSLLFFVFFDEFRKSFKGEIRFTIMCYYFLISKSDR